MRSDLPEWDYHQRGHQGLFPVIGEIFMRQPQDGKSGSVAVSSGGPLDG